MTNTLTEKKPLKNEYKSLLFILLVLALVYFPFVDKAANIDDTLFLKAAEQILVSPFDFYGGEVNWYGRSSTQFIINKNPPLVSYLIAGVASVFGFSEIALHTFFFLALALSAIGIFLLGRQFGCKPLLTTILATFTPVFLVHSTNLMTDSTMLMFWIWGLVFWMNGIKTDVSKWFFLAGLTVTLGILTKYTCVFLLPLMIFSGVWQYKKPGWWLVAIFIPLIAMLGFEYYTKTLYGKGLFFEAFIYANERAPKGMFHYFNNTMIGLAFLGGCFPVALFLGPLSGGRIVKLLAIIFSAGVLALILYQGLNGSSSFANSDGLKIGSIIQFCIFSLAGFCLVMAAMKELRNGLNHDSIFLLLWFFGIFIFGSFLNWTINARSFILLVPVVGIVLSRNFEQWAVEREKIKIVMSYTMMGLAGLIAVATVYADYVWANIARTAAKEITLKYKTTGKIFFQGHWGFQYYMEKAGALPVDYRTTRVRSGELVIIPLNNSATLKPDPVFKLISRMEFSHNSYISTMSPAHNSGFYASNYGFIPYSFEKPRREVYLIYRMQ